MIGLTQNQLQAVRNFREMLETQPTMEVLNRALRDKRFDSTLLKAIKTGQRLRQEQIDAMVGRYFDRALNYRAKMIARTETLRASNAGAQELWRQAREQGLLRAENTRRVWIVTDDERLCPNCEEVPDMNEGGVGLDEDFDTPLGPIQVPPLHPHCRCTVALKFRKSA